LTFRQDFSIIDNKDNFLTGENYIMDGIYNQENIFAEFAMQKTKAKKVKFLKEMRALKDTQPSLFKDLTISKKQFDNLSAEWDQKVPFAKMKADIKRQREAERKGDNYEIFDYYCKYYVGCIFLYKCKST